MFGKGNRSSIPRFRCFMNLFSAELFLLLALIGANFKYLSSQLAPPPNNQVYDFNLPPSRVTSCGSRMIGTAFFKADGGEDDIARIPILEKCKQVR